MKPYYEQDGIVIYHGDCREVMTAIEADVMVSDVPYGVSFKSGMKGDRYECGTSVNRPVEIIGDEDTSLRDWALQQWGDKPAIVFGSWKRSRPIGTRCLLTWIKGDHLGMGDLSMPWKPNTEEIYVMGRGFRGHRGTSALDFPAPVSWASAGRVHPHEKPIALMRELISKCPPGTILDPFMGSGTTLRAAKDLGRKAIGIEIDERYCEIAANRLAQGVLPYTETTP